MPDEQSSEPLTYQNEVDALIEKVLFDIYVKSPIYGTDKQQLMDLGATSDAQMNAYLTEAVAEGVSLDAASKCIILFLKLKISESSGS